MRRLNSYTGSSLSNQLVTIALLQRAGLPHRNEEGFHSVEITSPRHTVPYWPTYRQVLLLGVVAKGA